MRLLASPADRSQPAAEIISELLASIRCPGVAAASSFLSSPRFRRITCLLKHLATAAGWLDQWIQKNHFHHSFSLITLLCLAHRSVELHQQDLVSHGELFYLIIMTQRTRSACELGLFRHGEQRSRCYQHYSICTHTQDTCGHTELPL